MGNADAKIEGVRGLNKTLDKAERAIEKAVSSATDDAVDNAVYKGRQRISKKDAIWNKEVLGSFDITSPTHGKYIIHNHADHAEVVNWGGRWTNKYPPADALVPWVLDNLNGWDPLSDDDIDPDGLGAQGDDDDPFGGDSGNVGWGDIDRMSKDDKKSVDAGSVQYGYSPRAHDVDTNGTQGFPTASSVQMSSDIDWDNLQTIDPVDWDQYEALSYAELQNLQEIFEEMHGDDANTVISLIQQWEQGTWNEDARFYERIVQELYDVDAPLRYEQEGLELPVGDELEDAFHDLSVLSQEFLLRHVADEHGRMEAHRGMRGPDVAQLGKELFENPDASRWSFDATVVQNYSQQIGVADAFSEGISVSTTVDVERDVLMATDHMVTATGEAEIHVLGGEKLYSRSDIRLGPNGNVSADDIMGKDPQSFTDEEMDAMMTIVHRMNHNNVRVDDASYLQEILAERERRVGSDPYFAETVRRVSPLNEDETYIFEDGVAYDQDNNLRIYHGQKVQYMHPDGTQEEYMIDDWTLNSFNELSIVTMSGEELPADHSNTTDGEGLLHGENWWALDDKQQRDQLVAELLSKEVTNQSYIDDDDHWDMMMDRLEKVFEDEYWEKAKDKETARRLVHHMEYIEASDGAAARPIDDSRWALLLNEDSSERTIIHELGHGTIQSDSISKIDVTAAKNWNDDDFDYDYDAPTWSFDLDTGEHDPSQVTHYSAFDHGSVQSYTFGNWEDQTVEDGRTYNPQPYGFDSWFNDAEPHDRNFSPDPDLLQDVTGESYLTESNMDRGDYIQVELENGANYDGFYIGHKLEEIDSSWEQTVVISQPGTGGNLQIQLTQHSSGELNPDTEAVRVQPFDGSSNGMDADRFDWEPSRSNPSERLAEAANYAWWRQARTIQDDEDGDSFRDPLIRHGYSATNAHEVVSMTAEMMMSADDDEGGDIANLYWVHPYLVKGWLENYDASSSATQALSGIPDPELQQLL